MILFWILQSLINIVLVSLAVSYVMQKRRLLRLEGDLHRALLDLGHSKATAHGIEENNISLNTPLGSPTSTLSERKNSHDTSFENSSMTTSLSTSSRHALAQKLFREGLSLREVARKSGMSETELSLLKKCSPFTKNYETH